MVDPDRVVCSQVADRRFEAFMTPNSVQDICDTCYAAVWMAPSIMALITKAPARPEIICVPCWLSLGGWQQDKLSLAPGQLHEISRFSPDLALAIAKFFQAPGTN
jgi:hypothetical protein